MSFLPTNLDFEISVISTPETSNTFELDLVNNRILANIDQQDAVKQSTMLRILTERYRYLIHDQSYGCFLSDMISKDYPEELIETMLRKELTTVALMDSRVLAVKEITMTFEKESVFVNMKCNTLYGDVLIESLSL